MASDLLNLSKRMAKGAKLSNLSSVSSDSPRNRISKISIAPNWKVQAPRLKSMRFLYENRAIYGFLGAPPPEMIAAVVAWIFCCNPGAWDGNCAKNILSKADYVQLP